MKTELMALAAGHPAGYREVDPFALSEVSMDGVRVIDVREPVEFDGELGHLPGAELVPLGTLERAAQAWDRHATVLLVCRSGARSARAAAQLAHLGFTRLVNLRGGMLAYRAHAPRPERAGS